MPRGAAEKFSALLHIGQAGVKECTIGVAETEECRTPCFPVRAEPSTASPAQIDIRAVLAALRKRQRSLYEADFVTAAIKISKACILNGAEKLAVKHIEIAGVAAAVRFESILCRTDATHIAGFRQLSQKNA